MNPWNAARMGPKRDLIGELGRAVRKVGLRFGVSNHSIEHYTFIQSPPDLKTDLHDPKYRNFYWVDHSDGRLTKFLTLWVEKNEELIDKYRPDILWFDNGVNGRVLDPLKETVAAYYYNRAREWGKTVTISTKALAYAPSGDSFRQIGSVIDFEKIGKRSPVGIRPGPWEVDNPIGTTWGYTTTMRTSSADAIIRALIDTVSKGGNLLLNLSPRADGTFPAAQKKTLLGIGRWLKVNGDAIYGTRPWVTFGEGNIRFTTKNGDLYVIVYGAPEKAVVIRSLGKSQNLLDGAIEKVGLVGSKEVIDWHRTEDALVIDPPPSYPSDHAVAFRIESSVPLSGPRK